MGSILFKAKKAIDLILCFTIVFNFKTGETNFSYFDLIFLLRILISLDQLKKVQLKLMIPIIIGTTALVPPMFLIVFSSDLNGSIEFLAQYFLNLILLPIFCTILFKEKSLERIIKWSSAFIFLKVIFFILKYSNFIQIPAIEIFNGDMYNIRFYYTLFTPNESGHFIVLLLLLIYHQKSRKLINFRILTARIAILIHSLSFSKTVIIQVFLSFFTNKKIKFFVGTIFLMTIVLIYFKSELSRFTSEIYNDKDRIHMAQQAIYYIPNSIIKPLYYSANNLNLDKNEYGLAKSVHNSFLSFIVNLGLLSFFIYSISTYIYLKKMKIWESSIFKSILFIYLITLLFNPLLSLRIPWLVLYLLIYTSLFNVKPRFIKE